MIAKTYSTNHNESLSMQPQALLCPYLTMQYDNAIKDTTKALALAPNNTEALNVRGTAYLHVDDYE